MHIKTLYFILVVSLILFLANSFAIKANLYWTTPWADILTHAMGGMIVGGLTVFIFKIGNASKKIKVRTVILSTLIVGIAWELFEVYFGLVEISETGYFFDTLSDIFFDIIGAYAGYKFLVD